MTAVATELELARVPSQADVRLTKLSVEVISDDESFSRLEPVWDRLVEDSHVDHPFVTFPWVRTWWECFGRGRDLHILLIKEGETAIGIAPFMVGRKKIYGVGLRCLEFIANVHTPRFDLLIGSRHGEVYCAVWEHLRAVRHLWDVLLWCQIPEGSLALERLPQLAEDVGFQSSLWRSASSPYVLVGSDWEGYLKTLKAKYRGNLRRRMQRLQELGPVTREIPDGKDLGAALEEGLKLEGAVWKDEQGTSIQSQSDVELFYSRIATTFARLGWLNLNFLKVGDRRIAFQYAVSYKSKVFLLKPGYDPAYASYSPSNLLCYLNLEQAFHTGATEYDFLGIDEEWKLQWARNTRPHYWLFVFSNSLVPSLLYFLKFRMLPALQQRKSYQSLLHAFTAVRRRLGFSGVNL